MSQIDEQPECPLCMEPLEVDDLNFFPCTCGYQVRHQITPNKFNFLQIFPKTLKLKSNLQLIGLYSLLSYFSLGTPK